VKKLPQKGRKAFAILPCRLVFKFILKRLSCWKGQNEVHTIVIALL